MLARLNERNVALLLRFARHAGKIIVLDMGEVQDSAPMIAAVIQRRGSMPASKKRAWQDGIGEGLENMRLSMNGSVAPQFIAGTIGYVAFVASRLILV